MAAQYCRGESDIIMKILEKKTFHERYDHHKINSNQQVAAYHDKISQNNYRRDHVKP